MTGSSINKNVHNDALFGLAAPLRCQLWQYCYLLIGFLSSVMGLEGHFPSCLLAQKLRFEDGFCPFTRAKSFFSRKNSFSAAGQSLWTLGFNELHIILKSWSIHTLVTFRGYKLIPVVRACYLCISRDRFV